MAGAWRDPAGPRLIDRPISSRSGEAARGPKSARIRTKAAILPSTERPISLGRAAKAVGPRASPVVTTIPEIPAMSRATAAMAPIRRPGGALPDAVRQGEAGHACRRRPADAGTADPDPLEAGRARRDRLSLRPGRRLDSGAGQGGRVRRHVARTEAGQGGDDPRRPGERMDDLSSGRRLQDEPSGVPRGRRRDDRPSQREARRPGTGATRPDQRRASAHLHRPAARQ